MCQPNCSKLMTCGHESPTKCLLHASPDMKWFGKVKLVHKELNLCDECPAPASYGYPGEKLTKCKVHALVDMKDASVNRCGLNRCPKLATHYIPGKNVKRRCRLHASDGMIKKENVILFCECGKVATYGYISKPLSKCAAHAVPGMHKLKSGLCTHGGCEKKRTHGLKRGKRTHCIDHATQAMFNLERPLCVDYEVCCSYASSPRYRSHCIRCFVQKWPNEPTARNYKSKEKCVADFIKTTFSFDWSFDVRVGCSARRPDMACDFGSHFLIVEVDEHRHAGYACETKRDVQLWQDVGERKLVFLRFNPDAYGNVPSCWGANSSGLCVLKRLDEWDTRLQVLKGRVEYWATTVPTKLITREELFF